MCIEEPEIHLHPLLQRKLLHYLATKTTNQYFIATHSAHLLDSPETAIFRVEMCDGSSQVTLASTQEEKWEICRHLGCRASDILQSNCIIWVEGPSDRIYLTHWISSCDGSLIEGVHYSIMFYGGRLLNHLTVDDPEIDEFISLRRLNRNLVVVIDSDKDKPRARLNDTKKRIRDEFEQRDGFAWVTAGREIENYVDSETLRAAVEAVKPGRGAAVGTGKHDRAIPKSTEGKHRVDKLKVAQEVVNSEADLNVLDLKCQIKKLVEFIRQANS